MDGKEVEGRPLTVNEAKPMEKREFSRNRNYSNDRANEPKDAPKANPEDINDAALDSIEEESEVEVVDDDSDAEEGEEDFDDVEEAVEDSEDDEPAVEKASSAKESDEDEISEAEEVDLDDSDDLDFDDEED